MRFGVLGPLSVWTDTGDEVAVPGAKVRALLADLLAHHGRAVPGETLIEDLWEGLPPAHASGALQSKVAQLRRALELAEPGARALVETVPHGYRLRVEASRVDAAAFGDLVARAHYAEALDLWRGPAFAGYAEAPFARAAAERLEEQRVTAFEGLAEQRVERGEHRALADELAAMLAAHPRRERLHAVRIRALYLDGRQAEALAAYREIRDRLAEELGVDPGPELAALHQAVLRQDPALAGPGEPPASNLPVPLTALVGRDEAVSDVRELLRAHRLVTLTGPAGVGKTRLALEAARTDGDGAWLIELAGVDPGGEREDATGLADRIAAALGVRGELVQALRDRRMLLVLDTVEHLAVPASRLVMALLGAAPGLRVLATGREPLAVPGERIRPVPPLGRDAAVRLFRDRVSDAAPGFTADDADIAALCLRLDRLPLAIELAAARVRTLGLGEVAARLDDRFRLLGSGTRTLRAAFDWSWDLLDGRERAVLRRLSVCAGGFDLAAAEAVASGPGVAPGDVAGTVAALADRSLLSVDSLLSADEAGPRRFGLLESVAAYAHERLDEAGEAAEYAERHAGHFARLAEEADLRLRGPGQREWLRRLDAETANLRAALDRALDRGDGEFALRLCGSLGWYWFLRGRYREAHRSFGRALDADAPAGGSRAGALVWRAALEAWERMPVEPVEPTGDLSARERWLLGFARADGGDLPAAIGIVNEALEDFRRLGDRWGTAAALSVLGWESLRLGNLKAARRAGDEGLALFREEGDRWGESRVLQLLGVLAEVDGDYGRAERLHLTGLASAEELQLWPLVVEEISQLGRIAALAGDFERADAHYERAMRVARDRSFHHGVVHARVGLGASARRQGRLDSAEEHLRAAEVAHRSDGYRSGLAYVLAELGFVAELRGDAALARARHEESLALARGADDPRAVALATEGLAGAASLEGDAGEAARLLGEASAIRPLPPAERADVDRIAARARS
ncbi:BTAD domain-containing putative transcriptional regulator [Actinomadura sp. 7K507]|uniref:BTAD domain-containing putative transcriptional regulator n=1 Tax=Actinomadura sp. 7K507 TaxID=2530365 RepID=UPI00104A1F6A|nr:BTAD domain-containing putative transcriptional regulator [Actinomadura sp. 7K507]TDC85742.1 tetratricopeptide repeat protein [Actinomadura sp. 7K507]